MTEAGMADHILVRNDEGGPVANIAVISFI